MAGKTPEEVCAWIDSKEVLTCGEIVKFVYGEKTRNSYVKVEKYVKYMLETKDWTKLEDYRNLKITFSTKEARERYLKLKEIINSDSRFKTIGSRKGIKLLKQVYNIDLPRSAYIRIIKHIDGIKYSFKNSYKKL